jgi:hypothetical protein
MSDPGEFVMRTDDGAAARFAAAFDKYFEECKQ